MAKFSLRFYGRFVFAEPRAGTTLKALAIDPHSVPGLGAEEHRFFMTVPRTNVDTSNTTRPPDFALIPALDAGAQVLEQVIWNLADCNIKVQSSGELAWQGKKTLLADLGELTAQAGRFRQTFDRAKAVIDLTAGVVAPQRLGKTWEYDFVTVGSPQTPATQIPSRQLADMVEVALNRDQPLRFEITSRASPDQIYIIEVKAAWNDPTIITLSHLCAGSSQLGYDKEFAALYEALENPPVVSDRLVPRGPTPLTEFPCYTPAFIQY